jgi:hypothetical protein
METLCDKLEATRRKRASDNIWAALDAASFVLAEFRRQAQAGALPISESLVPFYVFDPAGLRPPEGSIFKTEDWEQRQTEVLEVLRGSTGMAVSWAGRGKPIELRVEPSGVRARDAPPGPEVERPERPGGASAPVLGPAPEPKPAPALEPEPAPALGPTPALAPAPADPWCPAGSSEKSRAPAESWCSMAGLLGALRPLAAPFSAHASAAAGSGEAPERADLKMGGHFDLSVSRRGPPEHRPDNVRMEGMLLSLGRPS